MLLLRDVVTSLLGTNTDVGTSLGERLKHTSHFYSFPTIAFSFTNESILSNIISRAGHELLPSSQSRFGILAAALLSTGYELKESPFLPGRGIPFALARFHSKADAALLTE